eukprot:jgi/Mesen1/4544/ME000232S03805
MLVGFISLLLVVLNGTLDSIYVEERRGQRFIPCKANPFYEKEAYAPAAAPPDYRAAEEGAKGRRLLLYLATVSGHGIGGKEPFVSATALHDLHQFIFLLACVHILLFALTMIIALWKVKSWRKWDEEAQDMADRCSHMGTQDRFQADAVKEAEHFCEQVCDPTRRGVHSRLEAGTHAKKATPLMWLLYLAQQFWCAVRRSDYLTMRMAFITEHKLSLKFDFHSYLVRLLESNLTHVVGIKWYLWLCAVIFLLLGVAIGAKLVHVMARLAVEN